MDVDHSHDTEIEEDLREEIERFKTEKERVRNIVGHIGGMPSFNTKLANAIFALAIVVCLALSFVYENKVQLFSIEFAVVLVSIKLMFLIHKQSRVSHFQLWILSSLEWRLDQIMKEMKSRETPVK
ncbi:MAG: hypothetical protein ACYS9X_08545 [Planctomycetota bacterium]|jgi:hypothetical protein